jgi:hypothetical protein
MSVCKCSIAAVVRLVDHKLISCVFGTRSPSPSLLYASLFLKLSSLFTGSGPCHVTDGLSMRLETLNLPMTYVREDWHLVALHGAVAWSLNCLFFLFGCAGVRQVAHDQGLLQEVSGQVQAQAGLVIVSCQCLWMWKQMLKNWRTCLLVPLGFLDSYVSCWHILIWAMCSWENWLSGQDSFNHSGQEQVQHPQVPICCPICILSSDLGWSCQTMVL